MNTLEKMEEIVHEMINTSQRLKANHWADLEIDPCSVCGYTGKVGA